jgi:hypothetical protein
MSSYSVHDILERIGRDLYDLDKTDIEACKSFLTTYESYLPNNHFYCTDVKYVLSQLMGQVDALTDDDLELKLQYCTSLENLLKIVAPAERRTLGTVLFEKHAAVAEVARRNPMKMLDDLEVSECYLVLICPTQIVSKESKRIFLEALEVLKNEPDCLPEGKIYQQAKQNLKNMNVLLKKLSTSF